MALVRWNPWNLSSMLDDDFEFPTLHNGISKYLGQGLNIYETEQEIVAEVALPGIPEDKIDVSIDQGVVRISASAETSQEDKSARKYFMSSMSSSYNYSFRLPEGSVSGEPEATLEHGVLQLHFKKPEKVAPKKIQIKSGSGAKKVDVK